MATVAPVHSHPKLILHQRPRQPVQQPQELAKEENIAHDVAKESSKQVSPEKKMQNQNVIDSAEIDDLSALTAQFRRREVLDKKSTKSTDPFERMLEEEAESKVDELLVIAKSPEINPDSLFVQVRSFFPDDSDFIMALREIIKRRKLADAKHEEIEQMELLLAQAWTNTNPKTCKAGINVGFKARLFAGKMSANAANLRDTYRSFLTSEMNEVVQYGNWAKQYGNRHRGIVVEYIEAALLGDIQSHDPSCSRLEFGNLLTHVVKIKRMRTSDLMFSQVINPKQISEGKLEGDILACWFDCLLRPFKLKKRIENNQLTHLIEDLSLSRSNFHQRLIRAVKQIDLDMFPAPNAQEALISALLKGEHLLHPKFEI